MAKTANDLANAAGVLIKINDPSIDTDWKGLLFNLGSMAAHGVGAYAGKLDSGANALMAFKGLWDSVKRSDPDGTKAWLLVVYALAKSVATISATGLNPNQTDAIINAFKTFNTKATKALKTDDFILSPDFFVYPARLDLYQALRGDLTTALAFARLDKSKDLSHLSGLIDSAFNASVHDVLRENSEYFSSLIQNLETPGISAQQHELDWARYRAHLISEFEVTPVFGQDDSKVSLSQLYVPLRAQWFEKDTDETTDARIHHTVWLEDDVEEWISNRPQNSPIKLIYGGPGCGKSTFAKALAAKLAKDEGLRPVFIELQKLKFDSELFDDIKYLMERELKHFHDTPISDKSCSHTLPFVLIFDGLDELARPGGKGADEVARDFANDLHRLLDRLNTPDNICAIAIVTGRDPIIEALKKKTKGLADCQALKACGYAPISMNHNAKEIEKIDQRPIWWTRFATARGKSKNILQAFQDKQLEGLSNEPLLCYLLAVSDMTTTGWEKAAKNHNLIYDKLLGDVWDRKWGKGRVGPTLALDNCDDFDLLMESMALAAWHGDESNNRTATDAGFTKAREITGANEAWNKFTKDQGPELTNLALTFYFKQSSENDQGFEFSHKSFSEYLVGRLLFKSVLNIAKDFPDRVPEPDYHLEKWLKLTGSTTIDEFIIPFIHNQARLTKIDELESARVSLEKLFNHVIRNGMPAHKEDHGTWRQREDVQLKGETSLLACLTAIMGALYENDTNTQNLDFDWNTGSASVRNFINRLQSQCFAGHIKNFSLSHINFKGIDAVENSMWGINFEYCNFSGANLHRSNFNGCRLRNVNMEKAHLPFASLRCSSLRAADLRGADLREADLRDADLRGADLRGADLRGANLRRTKFGRAKIDGAHLPENWKSLVTFDEGSSPIGTPIRDRG